MSRGVSGSNCFRHLAVRCIVLGLVGSAAACGGGGGGNGGGSQQSATVLATATATAPAPATSTRTFTVTTAPSIAAATPTLSPTAGVIATVSATATSARPTTTAQPPPATCPPVPTDTPSAPPTASATATPLTGPLVTAFGIADASGTFNDPTGTDNQGRPIFSRQDGESFIVYIEGRPGPSRLAVGTQLLRTRPDDPTRQPDLQMEATNALGNGSPAVCDGAYPTLGGVPAASEADFSPVQSISDALNDLSCRFRIFRETDFACTQDSSGNLIFRNPGSTLQFCTLVDHALRFPSGLTILSARVRDTDGNAGPTVQIAVRVTP